VNKTEPTHFSVHGHPTLIDIFATNVPDEVGFFTQVDLPACNTDHDLIYGSLNMPYSTASAPKEYIYRDYSAMCGNSLTRDVLSIDWSAIYNLPHVDNQISFLTTLLETYSINTFLSNKCTRLLRLFLGSTQILNVQ
jgi:hypothetical protein